MTTKPAPPEIYIHTCPCKGCEGLRKRYGKDITQLEFNAKKLLQRGWPGVTDDVEKRYRLAHSASAGATSRRMAGRGFGKQV
jgi:hypothetical protein